MSLARFSCDYCDFVKMVDVFVWCRYVQRGGWMELVKRGSICWLRRILRYVVSSGPYRTFCLGTVKRGEHDGQNRRGGKIYCLLCAMRRNKLQQCGADGRCPKCGGVAISPSYYVSLRCIKLELRERIAKIEKDMIRLERVLYQDEQLLATVERAEKGEYDA